MFYYQLCTVVIVTVTIIIYFYSTITLNCDKLNRSTVPLLRSAASSLALWARWPLSAPSRWGPSSFPRCYIRGSVLRLSLRAATCCLPRPPSSCFGLLSPHILASAAQISFFLGVLVPHFASPPMLSCALVLPKLSHMFLWSSPPCPHLRSGVGQAKGPQKGHFAAQGFPADCVWGGLI